MARWCARWLSGSTLRDMSTPSPVRAAAGMPYRIAAAVGQYGERLAARYLRDLGYAVLAANWRCPQGEIDIVARDGPTLVVCEVKTRRGVSYGSPQAAVTPHKLARLRRLGHLRVDVVAVSRPPTGPALVEHLVGVG